MRKRRQAQARRCAAALVVCLPSAVSIMCDAKQRGAWIVTQPIASVAYYALDLILTCGLWAALLFAASRRRGTFRHVFGVTFIVIFTVALGSQHFFYEQYRAYMTRSVALFATGFWANVWNQWVAEVGAYLIALWPFAAIAVLAITLSRRVVRPRRSRARFVTLLVPVLLAEALYLPSDDRSLQAGPPDALFFSAVAGLFRARPARARVRHSLPVMLTMPNSTGRRPNIVLILLESVRADVVCNAHDPDCELTPYSNRVVPNRHALMQLRALDASTVISQAVLWAGVTPVASSNVMHSWPLLFDYAKARGYDTAYWTSQSILLHTARMWTKNLNVAHTVHAEALDPDADIDMGASDERLARYVAEQLPTLREPFLAIVQACNTHLPYRFDPRGPTPHALAPHASWEAARTARYKNAVFQNDRHVAEIIRTFREHDSSSHTVLVYTSDHAEALGEHHIWGHTGSLYDEEIHVPGWIDAPVGILTAAELTNLERSRDAYVTHVDLTATMLDLMGVWDDPGIAPYKHNMPGISLLRENPVARALPLSNCAPVWNCAFESWGYIEGSLKLFARESMQDWSCFDLASDPGERRPSKSPACARLAQLALRTHGRLPGTSRTSH